MSTSEDRSENGAERAALQALEGAVGKLLDQVRALSTRVEKADARRDEVEDLLRRITAGDENPAQLHGRVRDLENENADLRQRLDEGREGVERLLAKIRFLEDQR